MVLAHDEFMEAKEALIAYLLAKVKAGDWHAVQDAASDIRELDAKIELIAQLENSNACKFARLMHARMRAGLAPDGKPYCVSRLGPDWFSDPSSDVLRS